MSREVYTVGETTRAITVSTYSLPNVPKQNINYKIMPNNLILIIN